MKLIITNDNKQVFTNVGSTSNTILWEGSSLEAFKEETGFNETQLGGFFIDNGNLSFDLALKQTHDQIFNTDVEALLRERWLQLPDDIKVKYETQMSVAFITIQTTGNDAALSYLLGLKSRPDIDPADHIHIDFLLNGLIPQ